MEWLPVPLRRSPPVLFLSLRVISFLTRDLTLQGGLFVGRLSEGPMRYVRVVSVLMLTTLTGALIATVAVAETANIAGQVTAVAGPVTVTRAHVNPQPLKFRDALYWRDVVEAHKDGITRVLLGGKTTVTVRELSRLELREERLTEGMRYAVELLSGKVRATVARMLMGPGDQVEVRTWNVSASVRGTDFIVETVSDPLGQSVETVVVTLSGVVEVSNRLAGTGRVERIGASEAVRVSGTQDPVRFQLSADELKVLLRGLTPPRPEQARSGDKAVAVEHTVEATSLAVLEQSLRGFEPGGGQRNGLALGRGTNSGSNSGNAQPAATPAVPATPATPAMPAIPGVTRAIPAMAAMPAVPLSAAGTGILRPLPNRKIP